MRRLKASFPISKVQYYCLTYAERFHDYERQNAVKLADEDKFNKLRTMYSKNVPQSSFLEYTEVAIHILHH